MAFTAVHFLAGVVAAAGAGDRFGGADRLGIDDRRGGLPVAAGGVADLAAQGVVQVVDGAVRGPAGVVVVDGLPGCYVESDLSRSLAVPATAGPYSGGRWATTKMTASRGLSASPMSAGP